MNTKHSKLINLADIEGKVSPHAAQVRGALKMRAEALSYVKDVAELAAYLGGKVESLRIGEDWAISKEVFPGVVILFAFNEADDEFPARIRALYTGDKIRTIKGDELATITISCANQLLRYVRENTSGARLPMVCYKV
jgi:hypothetical protein